LQATVATGAATAGLIAITFAIQPTDQEFAGRSTWRIPLQRLGAAGRGARASNTRSPSVGNRALEIAAVMAALQVETVANLIAKAWQIQERPTPSSAA
jgi:hypothetical protein